MHIVRLLCAACVAAAALTASAKASAADYHATVHTANTVYGSADNGASCILKTNVLHQTCNTFVRDFVTHEMWYLTDSSQKFWVEVGFYDGEGNNALTNPCLNDVVFWADSRPDGGGFFAHFYNVGWNFGDYYQAEITAVDSCTWDVVLGGLVLGTSTSNCAGSGRLMQAGIETSTQGGSVQGFATGFQAQDSSGNWSSPGPGYASGWGPWWMNWDNQPLIQQVADSAWGMQTEETLNEPW